MTIAVDFDGVIHKYSRGWQSGEIYDPPMPGAIEAIQEIMDVEAVVIFTARTDLEAVVQWLVSYEVAAVSQAWWDRQRPAEEHGSAFWNDMSKVLVTNRKPAARWYLDDRAVLFTPQRGWNGAMKDMGFKCAAPVGGCDCCR